MKSIVIATNESHQPAARLISPGALARLRVALCGVSLAWIAGLGCSSPSAQNRDLQLVQEAWTTIERNYVEAAPAKRKDMAYGAIAAMVDSLGDDGHSTFLPPSAARALEELQKGKLRGIGLEIESKAGRVVVVAPLDGSPAERAGIHPGDIILKVGTETVTDWPLTRVVERISGPAGSPVSLTVEDPKDGGQRVLRLKRASVVLHPVSWSRLPGSRIAHVRLASFDRGAARDFKTALEAISKQGLDGLILDLRNNPGGLLSEAVDIASQFLPEGNVLLSRNAQGQTEPVPVLGGGLAPRIPVAVLVNEGTASAAEIVAGALQDADRARLVGNVTFGTGTVLQEFKLADGSALLLAVEEWLTPHGRSFWHKGIQPDLLVTLPDNTPLLAPRAEKTLTPAALQSAPDRQLLAALQLLQPNTVKLSTSQARTSAPP